MKPDSAQLLANQTAGITVCRTNTAAQRAEVPIREQVSSFFSHLFDTSDWPPRWYCGEWSDFHGWLYIISDVMIWAAYFAIPILLLALLRKRKDIPFHGVFLLFVAFILLCGLTHLVDAWIFWWPIYRVSALLRLATAIVSVITVYALYKTLPRVLNARSVEEYEQEIAKRKIVEEKLAASEFLLSEAGRISEVGGWETDLLTKKRMWSKTIYDILELPEDYPLNELSLYSHVEESFRTDANEAVS